MQLRPVSLSSVLVSLNCTLVSLNDTRVSLNGVPVSLNIHSGDNLQCHLFIMEDSLKEYLFCTVSVQVDCFGCKVKSKDFSAEDKLQLQPMNLELICHV